VSKLARVAPAGLLKVEEARQMLAACKTLDEAKSIRDKAEAIRIWLRSQRAGTAALDDAAEIKLRAEHRLGELIPEEIEPAGRPPKSSHDARITLKRLGITESQSSRWQTVASVSEKDFEAHIQATRRAGERITTAALTSEVKRTAKLDAIAKQARAARPLADVKPCPVVYADPPWQYGNTSGVSAAEDEYPTLPLADICALVAPATPDAVLFLWATSPLLPEALQVITAWGFSYKGSMVWDKDMGTGNWVLNCHELLLIAVRGDMPCPAPANRPKSVVHAPRGGHSAKPEEFAALIDRMYPGLPKVEMFARRARSGWTVWGNEAA
jgi:N6-adenosine-specific RNA methylase IME4